MVVVDDASSDGTPALVRKLGICGFTSLLDSPVMGSFPPRSRICKLTSLLGVVRSANGSGLSNAANTMGDLFPGEPRGSHGSGREAHSDRPPSPGGRVWPGRWMWRSHPSHVGS